MRKSQKGFTLVEIMMVVAIIALLAAVGIPSFLNSRQGAEASMKIKKHFFKKLNKFLK